MSLPLLSALGFGFLLGLRHALDPDHLVAVSTLVTEERGIARAARVGALWGLGHGLTLLVAGSAVIVLRTNVADATARSAEHAVAVMLVLLGLNAMWRAAQGTRWHVHEHGHDGRLHRHYHFHRRGIPGHDHHPHRVGRLPLVVGAVHGLAGTAGLTLLAIAAAPGVTTALAYLLIFGIGAMLGMAAMSALFNLATSGVVRGQLPRPIAHRRVLQAASGVLSVSVGTVLLVW